MEEFFIVTRLNSFRRYHQIERFPLLNFQFLVISTRNLNFSLLIVFSLPFYRRSHFEDLQFQSVLLHSVCSDKGKFAVIPPRRVASIEGRVPDEI